MLYGIINLFRLARAGATLLWHGVQVWPDDMDAPAPARALRRVTAPLRARRRAEGKSSRLSKALAALGPSYIKLGQFLATRRDVIGPELANDLANLQDRLPPFPMSEARHAIRDALARSRSCCSRRSASRSPRPPSRKCTRRRFARRMAPRARSR